MLLLNDVSKGSPITFPLKKKVTLNPLHWDAKTNKTLPSFKLACYRELQFCHGSNEMHISPIKLCLILSY